MITLRAYQSRLVDVAWDHVVSRKSLLMVAPTGSGKTVMFCALARRAVDTGQRVTILAHRIELIEQISATLNQFSISHGIIAAHYPSHGKRPVQVASVQTLVRRLGDYVPPDIIIADEANHAIRGSVYHRVMAAYKPAAVLGVTATPQRLGGEGLHDTFGTLLLGPSASQLIEHGDLCPYTLYAPPATYMDNVRRRMGDYDKKQLQIVTDKPKITGDAVTHYRQLAHGKRALVFCVSRLHAEHVANEFAASGYVSMNLDGSMTPKVRAQRVKDFTEGRIQVLTSCDLVSEGFDLPALEVAILLRPTQSLALYLQQVGRSLRPYQGKTQAIILDHAGNALRHGLPDDAREWSLDGQPRINKSKSEQSVAVKTCGLCFLAVRATVSVCPHCNTPFPVNARRVNEVDGQLTKVDAEQFRLDRALRELARKRQQSDARSFDELLKIEAVRGYKPGWARYVWKARKRNHSR